MERTDLTKSTTYKQTLPWFIPFTMFVIALLPRIVDLDVFLTADEDDQIMFASLFLKSALEGDLSNALVLGYPGVPTLVLGAIGVGLRYAFHYAGFLPLWWVDADLMTTLEETTRQFGVFHQPLDFIVWVRLPMVIAASLCIVVIYLLLRRLLNNTIALVGTLIIAFDPFILAHSRVIHVDAPLAYFMFIAFLAFTLYIVEGKWSFLLISGLFAGLAALSKTGPAGLLGPILAVSGLIYVLLYPCPAGQSRWVYARRLLIALFGCGLIGGLAFFALWPTMWQQPLQAITWIVGNLLSVNSGAHPTTGVFWGGRFTDQSPFYYLIVFPYHLTPLSTVGFIAGLSLIGLTLYKRWQGVTAYLGQEFPLALSLVSYIVLFMLPVSLIARRGDRYILPVYFAAGLLATLGLWWIAGFIIKRFTPRPTFYRAAVTLGNFSPLRRSHILSSFVTLQIIGVMLYSPYYLSYYNPLLGGSHTAPYVLNIGWGEGLDEAARYLNTITEGQASQVAAWYSNQFAPFYEGNTVDLSNHHAALYSDYTVFYLNQIQRGFPSQEVLEYFRQREPLHVVSLGGVEYAWIYEGPVVSGQPAAEYTFEVGKLLGGGASLLGVDVPQAVLPADMPPTVSDTNSQSELFGNDAPGLPITLHWETVSKIHGEHNIYIRLKDEQGHTWGQIDRMILAGLWRPDRWRPGFNIKDEYRLPIDPATPPGTYHLEVGLYDFVTGDTYGIAKNIGEITLTPPQQQTAPSQLTMPTRRTTTINENLAMVGHSYDDVEVVPGQTVRGKIFWQLNQATDKDYEIQFWLRLPTETSNQISSLRGQLPARFSGLAAPIMKSTNDPTTTAGSRYLIHQTNLSEMHPLSTWQDGDVYGAGYRFQAPPYAPAGEYPLMVSVIDPETGDTIGSDIWLSQVTVTEVDRNYQLPSDITRIAAVLNDEIELVGFKLHNQETQARETFGVSLYWRSLSPTEANYTVFIHAVGPDQIMRGQWDSKPVQGTSATSGWLPGEVIEDYHEVPMAKSAPAWKYDIFVGLYDSETGQRLPVYSTATPISDNRIWLERIQVVEQ